MIALVFALVGLVALVGSGYVYVVHATSFEWTGLATFVGGTAGPLLSFLALLAVTRNLAMQAKALRTEQDKQSGEDHRRWIEAIYADINEAMDTELKATAGAHVTVRDVLRLGTVPATVSKSELCRHLEEFAKLLGQYCEAVSIYRENEDPLFDVRILVDRGARLVDRLKPFIGSLNSMGVISIEFFDMLLRGDTKRPIPEAMTRPTRR